MIHRKPTIHRFIIAAFVLLAVSSCSQPAASPTGTPTSTRVPARTATQTLTHAPTRTKTPTPQPTTVVLPKGEYPLIYRVETSELFIWNFEDNTTQTVMSHVELGDAPLLSPDGKYIAQRMYDGENFIGLTTFPDGHRIDIDAPEGCVVGSFHPFSWSPDGTMLAVACIDSIRILHLSDQFWREMIPLPEISSGEISNVEDVFWSWDGNWLSFDLSMLGGDSAYAGPFLVDLSCIWSDTECDFKTISMPLVSCIGAETWLPDGQVMNTNTCDFGTEPTRVFSFNPIDYSTTTEYPELGDMRVQQMISNSDGEWILLADIGYSIAVISEQKVISYPDGFANFLVGWVRLQPDFSIGSRLQLTTAGDNLNLRAEPLRSSTVVEVLRAGMKLTILEGPVEAGVYTWWKVETEDGSTGWVAQNPYWYAPEE